MIDERISVYRDAVLAMQAGQFDIEVPTEPGDQVAELGQSLHSLARVLEEKFRETDRLSQVTARINAGLILDEVLEHVYESFRPILPYDRIGFALLEQDGKLVQARWARSEATEIKIDAGYSAELRGSSLERIIETGQPRILNNLEEYLELHPDSDSTAKIVAEGMRSSLTCPLVALGKPVGFIFFSSMQTNTYRNVHVELFEQIAGQLAVIVEKSRLYQQLLDLSNVKNKFLGIAAHDLRSPIGVLKGYLGLLLKERLGPVSESQREIMERMDATCEGMLALVNDLLDVSAIESGHLDLEKRPVDLAEFLCERDQENKLLAEAKSIDTALELQKDLGGVLLDPLRISQVINNLVSNAVKFSFPDTVVTVRAERADQHVRISVTDQGQGIPDEEIAKVFTEFGKSTVRPTAGEASTGLGLAIVKRIVQAHGGQLQVESQVGVGSTFSFTLPVSPGQIADAGETGRLPSRHRSESETLNCRVLLAEDSPDSQRLIRFHLKKSGAHVTTVADGQSAVQATLEARTSGEPFDVVLMDVQMPVLGGLEATRRLREQGYRGLVIALTAHTTTAARQKCLEAGCDDCMSKPVSRAKLVDTLVGSLCRAALLPGRVAGP